MRHLFIWLKAGKPIKSYNQEFRISLRSWITDCDRNIHVNTARYFVYMELARFDLSLRSGLYNFCYGNKIAPLVMGAKITYRREIKPFKKIEVVTKILGFDNRFMYFKQKILSSAGVHSLGYLRIALYKDGKFYPPEKLLHDLDVSFVNSPLPQDVQMWIEADNLVLAELKEP